MPMIDWQLTFFLIFAVLAVIAAVGVLVCRNPLHSALCMVSTMVSLAAIYLLHHAEFIAFVQIMVYAGAVMMLVVYVIMLLDVKHEAGRQAKLTGGNVFALVLSGLLFLGLLFPLAARLTGKLGDMSQAALMKTGSVEFLAEKLFGEYLLPFEVASVILTVGLVGAVALAKKKL
ncbi:MAG: NADH-quinone oxidoreductase subunit J [Deltaproteobacteria bacterium]|nr:NADH-quinone oxidoreductase subunit J [Deltaproteobacteria bacterium]